MPKHIVRLIILLVGFVVAALMVKSFFTDESFYRYGHYRADSVPEIAAQELVFQTPRYCRDCHTERVAQWSANNHKTVSCEVCHGPAQGHPQKGKLPLPSDSDVVKLCTLCHEAMPGRPRTQPQIQVASHNPYTSSGTQCTVCHNPHSPKLAGVVAAVTGSIAEGKKRAASCDSCHGADGISPNDAWPNLAGQNAAYLVRILAAYKSGAEKDVMMSPVAQALSDTEIQDLATYYASLSCKEAPSAPGAGDTVSGKALAAKNCAGCHGETGIGSNPAWPTIAGQKAGYLVNMLKAFRAGLRKDPMMAGVTRGLSDADIANLAAYYAGQSCESIPEARTKP
jgi:cytochrome c553